MDDATFRKHLANFTADSTKKLEDQFTNILQRIGWTEPELLRTHHKPPSPPSTSSNKPAGEKTAITEEDAPVDLRCREQKLLHYEMTLTRLGHFTEPEMSVSVPQHNNESSSTTTPQQQQKTFAEITSQRRDLKRRRQKYRTTKAPPLSHSEEMRVLIALQMDAWQEYVEGRR